MSNGVPREGFGGLTGGKGGIYFIGEPRFLSGSKSRGTNRQERKEKKNPFAGPNGA